MSDLYRAVIWDMGGVILRTEDHTPRLRLAERLGVSLEELYRSVFASETARQAELGLLSTDQHWRSLAERYSLTDDELVQFQNEFWAGDRFDALLLDYIDNLRPQYKTALLSNAWIDARQVLSACLRVFDLAIFSAEIGLKKPDQEIYLHALKALNVTPQQAIFIDDMPANVEGARRAGLYPIQFVSRPQVIEELASKLSLSQQ